VLLRDFRNIVCGYTAIKDVVWLYYYCGTNLAKTVATSELYFNVQAKPGDFLF